ncbi:uncharacterized protein LOC101240316 [Anopheles sinensis]|uniref:Uncharacterized protein LOC101240316 n=1 Tax=Anopheles sinensis TaxID=74873 RepID=A0A084VKQ0_ANOSI|nr:uncharacterized protein LOC101240316 [Anopheles sinensis]
MGAAWSVGVRCEGPGFLVPFIHQSPERNSSKAASAERTTPTFASPKSLILPASINIHPTPTTTPSRSKFEWFPVKASSHAHGCDVFVILNIMV